MRGTPPPPLPPPLPRSWETDIVRIEPGLESGTVFGLKCSSWPIEVVRLGFKHITHHRIIHIFRPHAVYTWSFDRPRLPCAVFVMTHISMGSPSVYIASL